MGIDDGRLGDSIAGLRAEKLTSAELGTALERVVTATRDIFGADGAGLMLIDDQQALHYVGTPDELSAAFEAAQEETGQGPCVDSLVHDAVVSSNDLFSDPRWPELTGRLEGTGIRSVLGVPIRLGGSAVGSLNVTRQHAAPWDESEVRAIEAHGRLIEELMSAALIVHERGEIVDQLNHALESRVAIERAVGVVMARRSLDPARAFNHLRMRARNERRSVRDVATEVLADASFAPPEPPPATGSSRGPA